MAESLRIGEVAVLTDVTVDALRFYEREGLLPGAIRTIRGARRFPPDVIDRVRFVKQAQAAGLTLRNIKELVGLRAGTRASCQRMRRVLAERLAEIDARLGELQTFRTILDDHIKGCDEALGSTRESCCPSLAALEHGNNGFPRR
jgi:DNA-binding transcriptional MerR regulator